MSTKKDHRMKSLFFHGHLCLLLPIPLKIQADNDPESLQNQLPFCYVQWQDTLWLQMPVEPCRGHWARPSFYPKVSIGDRQVKIPLPISSAGRVRQASYGSWTRSRE